MITPMTPLVRNPCHVFALTVLIGVAISTRTRANESAAWIIGARPNGTGTLGMAGGNQEFVSFDRTAAMSVLDTMSVYGRVQRVDVPLDTPQSVVLDHADAMQSWDLTIAPNPSLGETVFLQVDLGVQGQTRGFRGVGVKFIRPAWQFAVRLDDNPIPVSLSNPFSFATNILSDMIEVPVGSPFTLHQQLAGSIEIREEFIPSLIFPTPETYDAFGEYEFSAATRGLRLFNRVVDDGVQFVPVEAAIDVNGGPPPTRPAPRSQGEQLLELARRTIRSEFGDTFLDNGIPTLGGRDEFEPLAYNLPFTTVAYVENRMPELRMEIGDAFAAGQITENEYNRRRSKANRVSSELRQVKLQPTYGEFLRNRQASPQEILVGSLLELFFGSDPYSATYRADQPLVFPPPNGSAFTFSAANGGASVSLTLPQIWGGGTRQPEVLASQVSVRFENGQVLLDNLTTDIASYEIAGGEQTGVNHGYFPEEGQVWSSIDLLSGQFTAHGEGLITNDLYPANRPVFVFQDVGGRILDVAGELVVEAYADTEPMIVPGRPGGPPSMQPIAFAATRASFDGASRELTLGENSDNANAPDVSVVLTPTDVFGLTLDNAAEPLIAAQVVIDPMQYQFFNTAGDYFFSNADFSIHNDTGTFASGTFTNVRIDKSIMALVADVTFDAVTDPIASPFISAWQSDTAPAILLGKVGVADLISATANFSVSGMSPTDFMTFTVNVYLEADFDRDGDVDGNDFTIWQAGFGAESGAIWSDGDADFDGDVDGEDFLLWQEQFGLVQQQASPASAATIPEPQSLAMLLVAVVANLRGVRTWRA